MQFLKLCTDVQGIGETKAKIFNIVWSEGRGKICIHT